MKVGRPTKYKKKFCEMLVEHMKEGNSFETFGAIVHCTDSSLYNWLQNHPEFMEAKNLGKKYEQLFWEGLLKKGATGDLTPVKIRSTTFDENKKVKSVTISDAPGKFNATSVIFALKNKFPKQWRDRQEIALSSNDPLENLSAEEIKRRKELYASLLTKVK